MNYEAHPPIKLLKAKQVAETLNVSRAFAYRLMQTGMIPTIKIQGAKRVLQDDLLRFIRENRSK